MSSADLGGVGPAPTTITVAGVPGYDIHVGRGILHLVDDALGADVSKVLLVHPPTMGANGSILQMSGDNSGSFPQMPEGGFSGSMPQSGDFGASGSNRTTRSGQSGQNSGSTSGTANLPSGTSSQGTTLLGWILLGGGVIALAITLLPLLRKKSDLKEGRGRVLLLGLLLEALIGACSAGDEWTEHAGHGSRCFGHRDR